ncbi:hypothetical protein LC2W_0775 [Lacticaseibacillus paracasei]|uniref:Uncharacterized protein n=2 Tax=Lacticaseibacillus paracasei subsp. paracasei TaxID=47714 RepID=S2P4B1_LACPA|nr:hypothetical protein LC2W_0775 [Lacticaseibacillus paracasei]EPC23502.1 hypothetical protein Lpp226_0126 [Lacticaseibacillus paracasei subsp. paracasei Lpp226]EPC26154.1 hypothetical protein Lpp17_1188 [Lacticaseibacillus paracasei subsp. paracasei Lpp17]EPC27675.1 hypothetical protein Lpp46_0751 [Lacticaseibacillus paracasei subsp. paracasei Lpp46]EPC29300.1 hypothetical protein Lpp22_1592 [Lacticaseibacillus paracasei subsp. paracasei Lpp22]EPC31833.1 hypothetical protein Lpp223_2368 [Lac
MDEFIHVAFSFSGKKQWPATWTKNPVAGYFCKSASQPG